MRESPIMDLVEIYKQNPEYDVCIYDPHVSGSPLLVKDLDKAVSDAHLIILGVNHDEFSKIDFSKLAPLMAQPNILDTRNYLDRSALETAGFNSYLLGA